MSEPKTNADLHVVVESVTPFDTQATDVQTTIPPLLKKRSSSLSSSSGEEPAILDANATKNGEAGPTKEGDVLYDTDYPEGGYGYVVLFACILLSAVTMGSVSSLGIYQAEYAERFPEKSSFEVNLIGGLMGFFLGTGAAVFGRMGDQYGFKKTLIGASFLAWIGMFSAGFCDRLWQLYVTQGIIASLGQGAGISLFASAPAQWFKKRRALAIGVALSGTGFGSAVYSLLVPKMIDSVGVKHTLKIIASTNLAVSLIGIFLLRTRNTAESQSKKKSPFIPIEAMKTGSFWLVATALLVGFFGTSVPAAYFVQYTRDIAPTKSATLTSLPLVLWSLVTPLGRIFCGFLVDRFGPLNCYCIVWTLSGVTTFALWYPLRAYGTAIAYPIVLAIFATSFQVCMPGAVIAIFGPEALATNLGFISLFNLPGSLFGAPIAGVIRDRTHSFKWIIVFAGCCSLAGGILATLARLKATVKVMKKV